MTSDTCPVKYGSRATDSSPAKFDCKNESDDCVRKGLTEFGAERFGGATASALDEELDGVFAGGHQRLHIFAERRPVQFVVAERAADEECARVSQQPTDAPHGNEIYTEKCIERVAVLSCVLKVFY